MSERLRDEWNDALHSGREGRITLVGDKAIERVAKLEKALRQIATAPEDRVTAGFLIALAKDALPDAWAETPE